MKEMELQKQIDELASFIMAEVPGEPSRSEGAVATAIRIMRKQKAEIESLRGAFRASEKVVDELRANVEKLLNEREVLERELDAFNGVGPVAAAGAQARRLAKAAEQARALLDTLTYEVLDG